MACPGFFFCPHKPHPMGNEYHTICCGGIDILYGWEIVEGRDHTIPMGSPQFETRHNMKTVGLMLQITRSLWSTGKAVIMDSGFFVLKVLLKMNGGGGGYGSALMKKRYYWPRGVHRDGINECFRSKNVGDVGCLSGEWDETEFNVFVLKEPDYNIIMM